MASAIDLTPAQILSNSLLPMAAKTALLWRKVARRLHRKSAGALVIRVGQGRVAIDPEHEPDWSVYWTIFGEEHYGADYRDAVVVDIGAHRGYFLAYALEKGAAFVDSYEPEPTNFGFLERVRASYGSDERARANQLAVAVEPGTAQLHVSSESWGHSLFPDLFEACGDETIDVRIEPFAGILERAASQADGRRVIVKIDAEGIEGELVLKPSLEVWNAVTELFIEIHPEIGCTPRTMQAHLAQAGLERVDTNDETVPSVLHFVRR